MSSRPQPVAPIAPGAAGLLVTLALVAFNQRPALAAVPPLTDEIRAATGLSSAGIGLLTTVPLIVMGLGAPAATRTAARLGRERTLLIGLALVALGCAVRAVTPGITTLLLGAVVVGGGITTIGTLVPAVISDHLSTRAGLATGVTTFALAAGAVLAALGAHRLAGAGAEWSRALALWALPALVAAVLWWPLARRSPSHRRTHDPASLPWRNSTAWLSAGLMALESAHFFVALAWVTPTYDALGMAPSRSALMLGLLTIGNLVGALGAPWLVDRVDSARGVLVAAIVLACLMTGVLAWSPAAAPEISMWLLGLGLGGGFGVALLLLVELADGPVASSRLSAMTFLVAYLLAAPVPTLFGLLRDRSTDGIGWTTVLVMALLSLPFALALGPARHASIPAHD